MEMWMEEALLGQGEILMSNFSKEIRFN